MVTAKARSNPHATWGCYAFVVHDLADKISNAQPNRAIAKSLNGAAAIAAVWAFFRPDPYNLIISILALIPPTTVAIWFWSEGFYEIAVTYGDPGASLDIAVVVPSGVLAVRALHDFRLLSSVSAFICALAGGVAIAFLMAKENQRRHKPPKFIMRDQKLDKRSVFFATMLIVGGFYTFGATVQANALLDMSSPEIYKVQVLRKNIFPGYRGGTHWGLWLSPWGPRKEMEMESVPPWLYKAVTPGQEVCVNLRSGALNMPWYRVMLCP
jgi:hypothetical protein